MGNFKDLPVYERERFVRLRIIRGNSFGGIQPMRYVINETTGKAMGQGGWICGVVYLRISQRVHENCNLSITWAGGTDEKLCIDGVPYEGAELEGILVDLSNSD